MGIRSLLVGMSLSMTTLAHAWITTIPGHPSENAEARSVAVDATGDVLAGGTLSSSSARLAGVARFAGANGQVLWSTQLFPGYGAQMALAGGVNPVVAGYWDPGYPNDNYNFGMAWVDAATGAVLWGFAPAIGGMQYFSTVVTGPTGMVAGGSGTPSGETTAQFYVEHGWEAYLAPYELSGVRGPGIAIDAAFDPAGDVIAIGLVHEVVPGVGSNGPGIGPQHLFAVKFAAADGTVLWQHIVDDESFGQAVAVDALGNVLVTGAKNTPPGYGQDLLVVELAAADGSELWRYTVDGGGGHDLGMDIALDGNGDAIVSGRLEVQAAPAPPDFPIQIFPVVGIADLSVFKLAAADGSEVWRQLVANTSFVDPPIINGYPLDGTNGEGRAIAFDPDGHPVVAGVMNASSLGAGASGSAGDFVIVSVDDATGAERWRYTVGQGAGSAVTVGSDGIVAAAGRLLRHTGSGDVQDFAVVKLADSLGAADVLLVDDPNPARRRIKVTSKDRSLTQHAGTQYGNPVQGGGRLVLVDPETSTEQVLELPAAGWRGSYGAFEFKSRTDACRSVKLRAGKGLTLSCKGASVHLPTGRPTRGVLGVRLELGAPGIQRYCLEFGGSAVVRDDTTQFKAKKAGAPTRCGGS